MRYYEVEISAETPIFNRAKDGQISYLKKFFMRFMAWGSARTFYWQLQHAYLSMHHFVFLGRCVLEHAKLKNQPNRHQSYQPPIKSGEPT